MPDFDERLRQLLEEHTRPSRVEIVRAKDVILTELALGKVHQVTYGDLLSIYAMADGLPPHPPSADDGFVFAEAGPGHLESVVKRDHPVVRWWRAEWASREAIAEIGAAGLIVPMGEAGTAPNSTPVLRWRMGGASGWVSYTAARPAPVSNNVRIVDRLREKGAWHLDSDLFLSKLGLLELDERTERCVKEALEAYRRELYLACANLLGAASEGACYAAGVLLAPLDAEVQRLVGGRRTAEFQDALFAALRRLLAPGRQWEADDLATQAELLRNLRNYGVHPRGGGDVGLERFFTEEPCGLLLLNTYRYLAHLAVVVAKVTSPTE